MHTTLRAAPAVSRNPFRSPLFAAALAAAAAAAAAPAGATVLVADNFNDVAPGAHLNGRAPQTSIAGTPWIATANTFLGNAAGGLDADSTASGSIHVDLGAGYLATNKGVYELQLDITQPSGFDSGSWIGFGFGAGVDPVIGVGPIPATGWNLVDNRAAPWLLWRLNGHEVIFAGPRNVGTILSTEVGAVATGTTRNFRLVLDTTGERWTVDAFLDGVQQDLNGDASMTYTYAPGRNPLESRYVSISTGLNGPGAPGAIDNLMLTGPTPVPEPGTLTLATAGVALLTTRRRRHA